MPARAGVPLHLRASRPLGAQASSPASGEGEPRSCLIARVVPLVPWRRGLAGIFSSTWERRRPAGAPILDLHPLAKISDFFFFFFPSVYGKESDSDSFCRSVPYPIPFTMRRKID